MNTRALQASARIALCVVLCALLCTSCQRNAAAPTQVSTPAPESPPTPPAHGAASVANVPQVAADVAPQPTQSAFVLPGAFAIDDTVATLQQRFGKDNVAVDDLPGAEGETSRGVVLFAKDDARRAYVYFQDDAQLKGVSMVTTDGIGSLWRLENGVHPGMTLTELVALNGAPIEFSGFEWDYGGYVSGWGGGKLTPSDKDPVQPGLRLQPRDESESAQPLPSGDATFRSDDRKYPGLGDRVIVGQVSVSFPGEDDL